MTREEEILGVRREEALDPMYRRIVFLRIAITARRVEMPGRKNRRLPRKLKTREATHSVRKLHREKVRTNRKERKKGKAQTPAL